MTEQSFTAEQLEQAARAILIDHKYSISDIKDQYKQQIYEALIKLSPAFALSYIPESERTPYALKYFSQNQIIEDNLILRKIFKSVWGYFLFWYVA